MRHEGAVGDPAPGGFRLGDVFRHPDVRKVARPVTAIAALFLVLGALTADGALWLLPLGFLYGWVWWTFLEYLLHRFVLHWEPTGPRWRKLRTYLPGHRGHHTLPENPDNAVTADRLWLGLPLGLPLFLGMLVIGFPPGFAFAAMGGGAIGYLGYEVVHFACHHVPFRRWPGRVLRRHHGLHHYRDETVNFGVTTTLWDRVFGTYLGPSRRARA